MATANLLVHVKGAKINDPDVAQSTPVQILLKLGATVQWSDRGLTPDPEWNQDFTFVTNERDILQSLVVELHKPKPVFGYQLLGTTSIPLSNIRHSNKASSGYWSNFFVLTNRGNLVPTRNQILLDAHFELPRGLPPDLVEILEKKLQKLDSVLEKEMEIIEDQRHRIITGELTPPTYLAGVPSYLFRDASNSHCSSATSEGILSTPTPPPPGAPLVSSSPPSPYRRHVTPTRRLIRSDQHVHRQSTDSVASDDPFASFDWQRSDFDPAGTDGGRRHRGNSTVGRAYPPTTTINGHAYEQVDYEPTRSPPRSLSIDLLSSAADRSPRAQKLNQYKKASSFESHLEVDRNVRRPYMPVGITVEDLDRGAASAVSKSPGRRSLGVTESPARFSPRFAGRHSRDSSIGSRSEEEVIVQRTRADSSVGARERWKRAVEKQLPEIRRRMTAREKTFPGLSGNGAISLVELVDQLQGYKKMSENIFKDTLDFSALNTEFRSRSRSVIDVKRRILHKRQNLDERVRMLVFRKTMEALIYPASEPDVHQFEVWSARRPTACSECNYPLWGLTKQGVKCAKCGLICHDRCKSTVSQDCFVHDAYSAVNDKMQRMVINHANRFELLREAFNVPLKRNEDIQDEIKGSILDMVENFSGDITVKVVAAQGLLTPKSGDQRCYVTVAVGSQKKKTSTFKRTADDKNPPHWNEEFTFQCFNWHETIKIRVWNERDTAMAHMVKRLTNEGSTFLGEKIIEVRRVGPPQEVWYKLEKRSIKEQEVSGHIKLNISATIDGEEIRTPFHEQYTKLHEQLFFYCYLHNQEKLVQIPPKPPSGEEGSEVTTVQCLPPIAQEVVDEFALRYAIDPIYRMMVHIELLVNHHSLTNALTVTGNLLKNLKYQMFMHVVTDHAVRAKGASELMEEYMDASNFGRDNFSSLLDRLLTSLKLDLQQYREFYPSSDDQKLTELVDTCQLMSTVLEFQQQAMGMLGCGKLEDLVLENMKECVRSTFEFIVENSLPSRSDQDSNTHPGLNRAGEPFEFFYNLLRQMRSVIQEDRRVYAPRIKTFCPSYDFGDVSANDLWTLFSSTIEGLFDVEANLEIFEPKDYVSLLFSVKSFYEAEIKNIKGRVTQIPEYPRWFVPCVKKWLQQFQRKAVEFVDNAWEDDKVTFGFAPHEQQKFTSSTFQTFFFLNQGYELISSLQSEDQQVRYVHYEEFSRVIVEVVGHYIEKVCQHIPAYETDLGKMCMLLNNLHALRINIQDLFNVMGGEENAGAGANKILSDFQSQELRKELQAWCNFVARSMTPGVLKEIKQFQFRLLKFKGQGSIDREGHVQTDRESMKILAQPLMDYLTKQASTVADTCELVITKLVIKELWHICVEGLHRMLLPMLKYDQDGGGERSSEVEFTAHHYSTKQCYALEALAEILKDFFTAGEIVKQNTIEKGMKNLRSVIGFYRDTTEMLITGFMKEETTHPPTSDGSCGEVMLEVDAYAHTTKLDGTVRVLAASELCGVGGVASLKPSIELTVIAPKLFGSAQSRKDLRFHTASKTGSSPKFNESFKFTLQNWEYAEIQLVAKHKAVFGKDRVIGVAVIPFSSVTQDANLSVGLSPSTPLSMHCQAILNVLSVRTYDEAAKDFVALKRQQRENTTSYAEE